MNNYTNFFFLSLLKGLEEFAFQVNADQSWVKDLPLTMKLNLKETCGGELEKDWIDFVNKKENLEQFEQASEFVGLNFSNQKVENSLVSIFNLLGNSKETITRKSLLYNDEHLIADVSNHVSSLNESKQRWDDFLKGLPDCNGQNELDTINNVLFRLKLYASFIGSATPGISLYDSIRLRCAVFASIKNSENKTLRLFCADISGIQKFIYDISSRQASRGLRGRSFYLQLLSKDIALKVMELAGVSEANLIYSSGGKFFILSSSNQLSDEKIDSVQFDTDSFLWDKFKGTLSVQMAAMDFKKGATKSFEFLEDSGWNKGSISELWKSLLNKVSKKKSKKFGQLFSSNFNEMFVPFGAGGQEKICAVSGLEITNPIKLKLGESEELNISKEAI